MEPVGVDFKPARVQGLNRVVNIAIRVDLDAVKEGALAFGTWHAHSSSDERLNFTGRTKCKVSFIRHNFELI